MPDHCLRQQLQAGWFGGSTEWRQQFPPTVPGPSCMSASKVPCSLSDTVGQGRVFAEGHRGAPWGTGRRWGAGSVPCGNGDIQQRQTHTVGPEAASSSRSLQQLTKLPCELSEDTPCTHQGHPRGLWQGSGFCTNRRG